MIPSNIAGEHVIKAIREIDLNGIPAGRSSRAFVLVFEEKPYPPKYVLSLANKFANKDELDPSTFSGGQETNDFLKELGFDVIRKSSSKAMDKPKPSPRKTLTNDKREQDHLEHLLHRSSLPDIDIVQHHIQLAEQHYRNSNYDDSISNSRKFFESILQQVAHVFSVKKYGRGPSQYTLQRPVQVRDFLEKEGLITEDEKNLIQAIYGFSSATGGHPHIADKDQAELALELALKVSRFILKRYLDS